VPQGAVLSPTLYNFFTSDASTVDGLAKFVDDTALFVSSSDPGAAQLIDWLLKTMEDKGEFDKNAGYILYQTLVSTAASRLWDSS
jgi:hypothetical protein